MIIKYYKKAGCDNKILLRKQVIESFGKDYYMEIHQDKIVLIPIKK